MERHFERELEGLKTMLMKMASMTEDNYQHSIRAVVEKDKRLAESVIQTDARVDALEMEIDNAVVDILALQKPVASDLRLIIAALKINNDLERISDHAVNIAQSALSLAEAKPLGSLLNIPSMGDQTRRMLRDALDSFLHLDPERARAVCKEDDQIDDLNRANAREVITLISTKAFPVEEALDLLRVSRNLERVADLATNIAEEVVFLAQARSIKHHAEDQKRR